MAIATRRELSTVRYMEMLRNGYAMPSLAADSAASMRLRFVGTCFIAYRPPNKDELVVCKRSILMRTDYGSTDDRIGGS